MKRRTAGLIILSAGALPFLAVIIFCIFANNGISFLDNLLLCGFLYWWAYALGIVFAIAGIYFIKKK